MIKLTLENDKTIMIGVPNLQAVITGATGAGALLVLGGGILYDVRESPDAIAKMCDEYELRMRSV
ncbi:MAG: hypothetical protein KC451_16780 [Amylibacter sp.]|jgi:hypothetical protein|nr:hypothetical protein [Amylibacter sp.]